MKYLLILLMLSPLAMADDLQGIFVPMELVEEKAGFSCTAPQKEMSSDVQTIRCAQMVYKHLLAQHGPDLSEPDCGLFVRENLRDIRGYRREVYIQCKPVN